MQCAGFRGQGFRGHHTELLTMGFRVPETPYRTINDGCSGDSITNSWGSGQKRQGRKDMNCSPLIGPPDRSTDDFHSNVPACAAWRGPGSKTRCLAVAELRGHDVDGVVYGADPAVIGGKDALQDQLIPAMTSLSGSGPR
jgi:hypothetical protein